MPSCGEPITLSSEKHEISKHHKKKDKKKKKEKKKRKREKEESKRDKRSRRQDDSVEKSADHDSKMAMPTTTAVTQQKMSPPQNVHHDLSPLTNDALISRKRPIKLAFPVQYILAPMVGASELAFRLLCRRYGAQLAYTPMMSAGKFATDEAYRTAEFQTCPADRPLVCHFSANHPTEFAKAVQVAAPFCDAIDLNLGCPQRTAYVGHFGSYLLSPEDRQLVLQIIKAGSEASDRPIFCKIRLLDTLDDTIQLCRQLRDAGASLIAIHARYRATWERKGPGARDGPALLDQVTAIKEALEDSIPIIANGNVITFSDVERNLKMTKADGIMSAEGILDNPALFLPRFGSNTTDTDKVVSSVEVAVSKTNGCNEPSQQSDKDEKNRKMKRKLNKKLREIARIEEKLKQSNGHDISDEQREKLSRKESILASLKELENDLGDSTSSDQNHHDETPVETGSSTKMPLGKLYESAGDKLVLANEYLALVRKYPVKIRSVIFHTRRIVKAELVRYQLLEDCLACETVDQIDAILKKIAGYRDNPDSFVFDQQKATEEKEALERKKREEGKRKAFEARMIRKAKREGKVDLQHYLHIGAAVPSLEVVQRLREMPREDALAQWKQDHSQHCMSFHLDVEGCKRGRTCAFLHVDSNNFVETDEVAG